MKTYDRLMAAVRDALGVPLIPAPGYLGVPSAVYRCRPGRSDGALCTLRLTVRVFHNSPAEAMAELAALRRALVSDGDTGIVGLGGDAIVICETDEGSAAGRIRGTDLYYAQAGFEAQGRA